MSDLVKTIATNAKAALPHLAAADETDLSNALRDYAARIQSQTNSILNKNKIDIEAATIKQLSSAMIDRLTLNPPRIDSIVESIHSIAAMPSPVGNILAAWDRPNGLNISRVSVPLGVLGIIYESRPNVTVDAACLSLKSRNTCILRGGSESINTSHYLFQLLQESLAAFNLPPHAVSFIESTDRALVGDMLNAAGLIDVIIPRGGKNLTERVMNDAKMPVFAHLDGNCHTYIHAAANPTMARDICLNAKMRRTGVCGSTETILLDKNLPDDTAKEIVTTLINVGCDLAGDDRAQTLHDKILPATETDWKTEYLSAKCAIKYVDDVNDAVNHINHYGSHHTESIVTNDETAAAIFLNNVDSAIVMHNASTQFADGGEFGMGAEIGIATGRFHARGPVGLEQLTTYKYVVKGAGHTRPV